MSFLETGTANGGPVVVLLHGLAGSSSTWLPALPLLGQHAHVIAPDLLGHGQSGKPRTGDYSLGAYACGLRDLLLAVELDRVTVVGHSFGGGVGMQFAYQFPELTERLVLVSSGGLGRDVSMALRAASLPGTELALRALTAITPRWLARLTLLAARSVPAVSDAELAEVSRALGSFADSAARSAFVRTTRSVLDWSGQRLDSNERLHLLADVPLLLVGGHDDTVIPIEHTVQAHQRLPGSRLEIFEAAGHFPHAEYPQRFAEVLLDFLRTTTPAHADLESLGRKLRAPRHPRPNSSVPRRKSTPTHADGAPAGRIPGPATGMREGTSPP